MLKRKPQYSAQFGEYQYFSPENILGKQLLEKVLKEKHFHILNKRVSGSLVKPYNEFVAEFITYGGRLIYQHRNNCVYLWDNAAAEFTYERKSNNMTVSVYGLNNEPCWNCLAVIEKNYLAKALKNSVYSVVQNKTGITTQVVGLGGMPLEPDNYHPEVVQDFEYVMNEFRKKQPSGRIVILDGVVGTGKTSLIRSMFSELDALFLIIPVAMLSSLDSPQFLPVLLDFKENSNKPIVLVVEDGDHILMARKTDNLSSLATLLNLSDGILGNLIDMRIVISTNATLKEIDEAVLRPGRLCRRINVPSLEYEQANRIYKRIIQNNDKDLPKSKFYTLAEVYAYANGGIHTTTEKSTKRIIGFQHQSAEKKNVFSINNKGE